MGFSEVRNRARPLKSASKLTYAIVNDADSHIGAFPMPAPGDTSEERKQIARAYMSLMESICDPDDNLFRGRFEGVVRGL
jgi:hypothetical protein